MLYNFWSVVLMKEGKIVTLRNAKLTCTRDLWSLQLIDGAVLKWLRSPPTSLSRKTKKFVKKLKTLPLPAAVSSRRNQSPPPSYVLCNCETPITIPPSLRLTLWQCHIIYMIKTLWLCSSLHRRSPSGRVELARQCFPVSVMRLSLAPIIWAIVLILEALGSLKFYFQVQAD